jgi:hypothetical protein
MVLAYQQEVTMHRWFPGPSTLPGTASPRPEAGSVSMTDRPIASARRYPIRKSR